MGHDTEDLPPAIQKKMIPKSWDEAVRDISWSTARRSPLIIIVGLCLYWVYMNNREDRTEIQRVNTKIIELLTTCINENTKAMDKVSSKIEAHERYESARIGVRKE